MTDWSMPACQWLTPETGAALGLLCVLLAALVLGAVWLGFGPLRARLGLDRRGRVTNLAAVDLDGSLAGIWRLYRKLGRGEPDSRSVLHAHPTTSNRTHSIVYSRGDRPK